MKVSNINKRQWTMDPGSSERSIINIFKCALKLSEKILKELGMWRNRVPYLQNISNNNYISPLIKNDARIMRMEWNIFKVLKEKKTYLEFYNPTKLLFKSEGEIGFSRNKGWWTIWKPLFPLKARSLHLVSSHLWNNCIFDFSCVHTIPYKFTFC